MRSVAGRHSAEAAWHSGFVRGFVRLGIFLLLSGGAVSAQGQPSGSYGELAPGETREGVLAPATDDALVYHTYTVTVPAGLTRLTVAVDGMGNDIDLALKFGSEITSYHETNGDFDRLDFSAEPNPGFSLEDPAAGILYIDVVNLIEVAAPYALTVAAEWAAPTTQAPSGDPFAGTFSGQGVILTLTPVAGGYGGRLDFQGQSYPLSAQLRNGRLQGSFVSGDQTFPFEASLGDGVLTLGSGGASYRLQRQDTGGSGQATAAPAPPAATQPEPAPSAAAATGLEGTWTTLEDYGYGVVVEKSIHLLPQGRYIYVESGDFPFQEEGRYQLDGGRLVFLPFCGADHSVDIQRSGERLDVTAVDTFGDTTVTVYQLEPGSPGRVGQMLADIDAERAAFHARAPTGPIRPGVQAPEPGYPPDPNPDRIFTGATVFSEGELYTFFSAFTYVMDLNGRLQTVNSSDVVLNTPKMATLDYTRGEYRDTALWLFRPNGRVLVRYESYWNALDIGTVPITPTVTASWGRYRIEGDGVRVETDEGEQLELELIMGRRKLRQGGLCFDEIEWATEQLQEAN